jgi:hypothetical protein
MAKVFVKPNQGISVDGSMSRIVIGTEALFSIQSNDGKQGPRISAATFNQPSVQDPALNRPHFLLDGSLNLLGLKRSAYVNLNAGGFAFALKGALAPGFNYDLNGHFSGVTDLGVGGLLNVGVGVIDLGPLGKVNINTGVTGSFDAGVTGPKIWAKFAGGFEFAGDKLLLPNVDLDVRAASLPELPKKLAGLVADALKAFLKDAAKWLSLVRSGIVTGVSDVGNALKTAYGVTAQQAANLLKGAGYTVNEVGAALKTAYGASADVVASALKGAGYAVNEVGNFVKSAFNLGPEQLKSVLQGAGFAADQVKGFFQSLGGAFSDVFSDVGKKLDPTKW